MLLSEIKTEFEILFEDLATAGSVGLNSYEKSICLTYAQEQVVASIAESNSILHLDAIIKFDIVTSTTAGSYPTSFTVPGLNAVKILDRVLVSGIPHKQTTAEVVPVEQIQRMYSAAYKYPPKNSVYVLVGANAEEVFAPLAYDLVSYTRRYIQKPTPVILEALSAPYTIDGLTSPTAPVVSEPMHRALVNAAVQYAIQVYVGEKEIPASNKQQQQ